MSDKLALPSAVENGQEVDGVRALNNPLMQFVPRDPLMAWPWVSAFSVALLNDEMRAAFESETGIRFVPPRTPLDRIIDEATGSNLAFLLAFAKWFNENVWGDEGF